MEGKERALEKDVKDEKKSIDILKKSDSWGSDADSHEIKMQPLVPHHAPMFGPFGHMGGLGGLLESMRNRIHNNMHDNEQIFRFPHLSIFHPPVEIEEEPEENSVMEITIEEPKHDEDKKADKKDD